MAQQSPAGLGSVFQNKDGFKNYTAQVYVRHCPFQFFVDDFSLMPKSE